VRFGRLLPGRKADQIPGHIVDGNLCAEPGRACVLLGFQDCAQLGGDLRNAETFHGLGVRMIQLTYNGRGEAGSGCTASTDEVLTPYGRDLVRVLNEVGILVDLSHCGSRTSTEAIELSCRPVAVSHSACAAIHPHARNKSDDTLRALAGKGGYVGICLVPAFLAPRDRQPSVQHFVETWASGFARPTSALLTSGLDEATVRGVLGASFARFFAAAIG
jgi:microsomal dipeptidase-like Zn-dependent dipeptidase